MSTPPEQHRTQILQSHADDQGREEPGNRGEEELLYVRSYGAFERSFQAPQDVDETKIEASFSNGLLTATLPKRAEAQKLAKTIAVKAV
jgi:HSP20 family protein